MARNRMAGEELDKDNPVAEEARESVNDAVQDKSNNRSLDERFGEGFSDRVSPNGMQDATNNGNYSKKELLAEFRNPGKGVKINEGEGNLVDKFQGMVDSGTGFNNQAREYLEGHGVNFGGGGGKPETPVETPVDTAPPEVGTPLPERDPFVPAPTAPTPISGISQNQTVIQDNDLNSTVTGDGNNVNINQNNNVRQSQNTIGATNLMDNYVLNLRKSRMTS